MGYQRDAPNAPASGKELARGSLVLEARALALVDPAGPGACIPAYPCASMRGGMPARAKGIEGPWNT